METAIEIKAIFDRDHGDANEGWYARVIREDGQERDLPFDARRSCGDGTVLRRAKRAARVDGFRIPRSCPVSIDRY